MRCLRLLAALCVFVLALFAQTEAPAQAPPDNELYAAFLAKVVSAAAPVIGPVLGLTTEEVESLRKMAADCVAKQAAVFALRRSLTLKVRLEHLATGSEPADLSGQLLELGRIQKVMVLEFARQFRELIGEKRFARADSYIRSRAAAGFPEMEDRPRAVVPPVVVPQF